MPALSPFSHRFPMTTSTVNSAGLRHRRFAGRVLGRGRDADPTFVRLFARFALTGLIAAGVLAAIAFVVIRNSATSGAIRQAVGLSELAGRGIAEPLITPGVLEGNPSDLRRLDQVVRHRILDRGPIVRVKIWDASGRVIYSDATQLIGSRFRLGASELRTLHGGATQADASDLSRPENRGERDFHRLLEVYVGIRGPGGERLLYEDYERSSTISARSRQQWTGLLPALLGALLVLYLVQVPLAYSLARRLRSRQREREELLRRAIDASDLERRRIAADLHDGAVQRLAGVSLSLAAASRTAPHSESGERAQEALKAGAAATRETIRELRTLLVDIYPPTLQRSGLRAAIDDLVAPLRAAGISVAVDVQDPLGVPDYVEALLYRVSQEAIRNARAHGHPGSVEVKVQAGAHRVLLSVVDDGQGFEPTDLAAETPPDHFGLRLMRDLADHAGGVLEVQSSRGQGTSVRLEVPLP
jgi:signal transduction histidine kinase